MASSLTLAYSRPLTKHETNWDHDAADSAPTHRLPFYNSGTMMRSDYDTLDTQFGSPFDTGTGAFCQVESESAPSRQQVRHCGAFPPLNSSFSSSGSLTLSGSAASGQQCSGSSLHSGIIPQAMSVEPTYAELLIPTDEASPADMTFEGNYVIPTIYSPWYAAECFSPPPEAFLETHSLFDNGNAWPGYLPMYQLELDPLRTSMTTRASISIFGEPTEHLLEDTTSSASPRHNIVGTAVIRAAAHKRRRGNHRKLYTCPICLTSLTSQTNWKGHLNAHRGIKLWTCEKHDKCYAHKSGLQRHRRKCHAKSALEDDNADDQDDVFSLSE